MITTWARTRDILGLAAGQQALVDMLIPLVEQDYLHIRNKPFDVGNVLTITAPCAVTGNVTVTYNGTDFTIPVIAGDNAFVVARKISFAFERIIQKLTSVSGEAVTFYGYATLAFAAGGTGVAATTSGIDTIYPHGAELTAIKMIEHHLGGAAANVSSESLGDYSVTYKNDVSEYPGSIVSRITRYVSLS